MIDEFRFLARRAGLALADRTVTMPLVRWAWTGPTHTDWDQALSEFRPTDRETVTEMMGGRYLLAARLVDTHGVSPFSVHSDNDIWLDALHSFSWLRHFREARNDAERGFARTLVLDWIGREGRYDRDVWALGLTARRVLNWLRHFALLAETANPEQTARIARALATQIQSLKWRINFAGDPAEALFAATALAGVALCDEREQSRLEPRLRLLMRMIEQQTAPGGMHLSRNPAVQLDLLVELVSLRQGLRRHHEALADALGQRIEPMHGALDAVTLGTGEPVYFNGCGHLQHDLLISVQAQSTVPRRRESQACDGYGVLAKGQAMVVADAGTISPPDFTRNAHASGLAFEFSHGRELLVGSCGPAPDELGANADLFRQGVAHSGITIDAVSPATIPSRGIYAGRLIGRGEPPDLAVMAEDGALMMRSTAYRDMFGVTVERRLTLLAEGKTLVGQDRLVPEPGQAVGGQATLRFHLAPSIRLFRGENEDLLRLHLPSGAQWTFLWEGVAMRVEDSVRQSAYFGFHRTQQIVLEAAVAEAPEIAWIFTLEEH